MTRRRRLGMDAVAVPAVHPAADEEDVNQRPSSPARSGRVKGLGKMAVPIGVVAIVLMLVVPLPAALHRHAARASTSPRRC